MASAGERRPASPSATAYPLRQQQQQRVQEPNDKAREGLRQIVQTSREEKRTAYIFVNNRLEGNAPGTIAAVLGVED